MVGEIQMWVHLIEIAGVTNFSTFVNNPKSI